MARAGLKRAAEKLRDAWDYAVLFDLLGLLTLAGWGDEAE